MRTNEMVPVGSEIVANTSRNPFTWLADEAAGWQVEQATIASPLAWVLWWPVPGLPLVPYLWQLPHTFAVGHVPPAQ